MSDIWGAAPLGGSVAFFWTRRPHRISEYCPPLKAAIRNVPATTEEWGLGAPTPHTARRHRARGGPSSLAMQTVNRPEGISWSIGVVPHGKKPRIIPDTAIDIVALSIRQFGWHQLGDVQSPVRGRACAVLKCDRRRGLGFEVQARRPQAPSVRRRVHNSVSNFSADNFRYDARRRIDDNDPVTVESIRAMLAGRQLPAAKAVEKVSARTRRRPPSSKI
jgi:hypothetical protein